MADNENSNNGNNGNGNGSGNGNTTTTHAPTTTTTELLTTTTTTVVDDDNCTDTNLDGGYLDPEICEELVEKVKRIRIEIHTHCGALYSLDTTSMPIIQAYRSDAYDKPHVLIIEFDTGKQLKFYTNIRNRPHHLIKHIFLKNETFQKLVKDLGLNYTIDI